MKKLLIGTLVSASLLFAANDKKSDNEFKLESMMKKECAATVYGTARNNDVAQNAMIGIVIGISYRKGTAHLSYGDVKELACKEALEFALNTKDEVSFITAYSFMVENILKDINKPKEVKAGK